MNALGLLIGPLAPGIPSDCQFRGPLEAPLRWASITDTAARANTKRTATGADMPRSGDEAGRLAPGKATDVARNAPAARAAGPVRACSSIEPVD